MQLILVSACLLGEPVRYDGSGKKCNHEILQRWLAEGRIVSICPELAAGLPTPRPAAEISEGAGGLKVLAGKAKVIDSNGQDYSAQFVAGARQTLELIQTKNIRIAVLKENSPSCGSSLTYDGSFSSKKVGKPGVTSAYIQQAGVHVFNENQLENAYALLMRFEAENVPSLFRQSTRTTPNVE